MKKKFQCKVEDLSVIGDFILSSVEKDINEFNTFSPVFTPEHLTSIKTKINVCRDVINSSTVAKELKTTTRQVYDKAKGLRVKLNALEGYLKLGSADLDVTVEDTGLKSVRNNIARSNIEGLVLDIKKLLTVVKRNQSVLVAKGLKPELINELEAQINEIIVLNTKQNELISDRNRLTKQNIELFNDLWDSLQPILNAAKAIYKGVDDVKLKDYTIAQLIKRVNAGRKNEE